MSTLKDRLPAGSARNKIEFLADEIEAGLALLKSLGSPVVNLIQNGDFLSPSGSVYPAFYSTTTHAPKAENLDMDAYSEAASPVMMMPSGWGGEAIGYSNGFRSQLGAKVLHMGANVTNRDTATEGLPRGVKAAMSFSGIAYKAVALAPFMAQRAGVIDPKHGARSPFVSVAASVRLGSSCKWGLLELNPSTGEIEKVVFSEAFEGGSGNHTILRKDGLYLEPNKLYALALYDSQSEFGNGGEGLAVGWAAAFFNDKKDPGVLPTVWPNEINNEFHVLKAGLSKADVVNGAAVNIGHLTGQTCDRKKHITLRLCSVDINDNLVGETVEVTETRAGDTVTVAAPGVWDESKQYAICAKVSQYPQRIGFFKPDGTSALDIDAQPTPPDFTFG